MKVPLKIDSTRIVKRFEILEFNHIFCTILLSERYTGPNDNRKRALDILDIS